MSNQDTAECIRHAGLARCFYNLGQGYSPCTFKVRVLGIAKEFFLDDVSGGIVGLPSCPDTYWFIKAPTIPPGWVITCKVVCGFYGSTEGFTHPVSSHQDALCAGSPLRVELTLIVVGRVLLDASSKLPVLFFAQKFQNSYFIH